MKKKKERKFKGQLNNIQIWKEMKKKKAYRTSLKK